MKAINSGRKLMAIATLLVVVFAAIILATQPVSAATKTPAKVQNVKVSVRYAAEYVEGLNDYVAPVKLKWDKAKNAKTYQLAFNNGRQGWQYMKTGSTSLVVKNLKSDMDHNLRAYCKYKFKVRAINGSKKGSWSSTITTYTKPLNFDIDFPKITDLKVKPSLGSMKLTWSVSEPGDDEMISYKRIKYNVYGSVNGGKTWTKLDQLQYKDIEDGKLEYIQRQCDRDKKYSFKVVPLDNTSYKTFTVKGSSSNIVKNKTVKVISEFVPCYTTNSDEYLWNCAFNVRGVILHSVGENVQSAEEWCRRYNNEKAHVASVHGFIDGTTGALWQTLDWNVRAAHAASVANNRYIGIEMCESKHLKYDNSKILGKGAPAECVGAPVVEVAKKYREDAQKVSKTTYDSAVKIFAMLCDYYGFNPLKKGVIISHNEWRYKYGNPGHYDPEHLWYQLGLDYTMDGFRQDVAALLAQYQ